MGFQDQKIKKRQKAQRSEDWKTNPERTKLDSQKNRIMKKENKWPQDKYVQRNKVQNNK